MKRALKRLEERDEGIDLARRGSPVPSDRAAQGLWVRLSYVRVPLMREAREA